MNFLKAAIRGVFLLLVAIVALLLVVLNPDVKQFDVIGLVLIEQSLGVLVIWAFILGVLFTLSLLFIPSWVLKIQNKRLNKKLEKIESDS